MRSDFLFPKTKNKAKKKALTTIQGDNGTFIKKTPEIAFTTKLIDTAIASTSNSFFR